MNFAGYFDEELSTALKNIGEHVKRGRNKLRKWNNLLIDSNLKKFIFRAKTQRIIGKSIKQIDRTIIKSDDIQYCWKLLGLSSSVF
jgi:hypothetical protein